MSDIFLKIKTNFSKVASDMQKMTQASKLFDFRIKKALGGFDESNKKLKKLSQNLLLSSKSSITLGNSFQAIKNQKAGLAKIIKELSKDEEKNKQKIKELVGIYRQLDSKLKTTKKQVKNFGSSWKKVATGVGVAVGAFYAAQRVLSGFSGTFDKARNFTKEIKNVTTLTGGELGFEKIKKSILSLNPSLGEATDLTNAMYQAISAGIKPTQALAAVGTAAKLAKAGLLEQSTSVDILTTALNAYGMQAGEAERVSDLFFTTIKEGKITGAELGEVIGQSIPLFASAGISLEELTSGLATLTKVGVKGSEATTQLNAIVNAFLKPSKKMAEAITKTGFASGAAFIKSKGLAGAIKLIKETSGGAADQVAQLIPNIRGMRGAMGLVTDGGEEYNRVLKNMYSSTGATNIAFKKQIDTIDILKGNWGRLRTQLGGVVQTIIMNVAPTFSNLILKISNFFKKFDFNYIIKKIIQDFKKLDFSFLIKGFSVATKAIYSIVKGIFILGDAISHIGKWGGRAALAIGGIAAAVKIFNIAMKMTPVGRAITIISGLVGVSLYVIANFKKFQKAFLIIWKTIQIKLYQIVHAITSIIKKTIGGLLQLSQKMHLFNNIKIDLNDDNYNKKIKGMISALEKLKKQKVNTKIEQEVTKKQNDIIQKTTNIQQKEITTQQTKTKNATSSIPTTNTKIKTTTFFTIEKGINTIGAAMDRLVDKTLGGVSTIMSGVSSLYKNLATTLTTTFSQIDENVTNTLQNTMAKAGAMVEVIGSAITSTFEGIGQILKDDTTTQKNKIDKDTKNKLKQFEEEKKLEIKKINLSSLSEEQKKAKINQINEKYKKLEEEQEKDAAMKKYDLEVKNFNIQKGLKIATIAINTATAIMAAVASLSAIPVVGFGLAIGAAATIGAMSAVQIGLVAAQQPPPPPFATGTPDGGFVVPPGYNEDNFYVAARSGETVKIENEEEENNGNIHITVQLDEQVLFSTIQKAIYNKEIIIGTA